MNISIQNGSTKRALIAMAEYLEEAAKNDKVVARRKALLDTAQSLRTLASSRSVTKLLDYME